MSALTVDIPDLLDLVDTITLHEAGLEEYTPSSDYMFGIGDSNACSVYSYTNWFYDGDESAFSPI
jgi:hypothetical protein